jgi:hypothetical protein
MIREQRDELLADHTGRTKDADGYSRHITPKKKPTRRSRVGRIELDRKKISAVEHNASDTEHPLSAGPLSNVEGAGHEQLVSIA